MRIYLTGRLLVESEGKSLDEADLPARQGRLAFAYLTLHRRRPVPRAELSDAMWGEEAPESWDAGLSAVMSRLRRAFRDAELDVDFGSLSGNVTLSLPGNAWIDLEAARNAIDEAEGLLRAGDAAAAWTEAAVTFSITERGFLHGDRLPWVVRERSRLQSDQLRALECLADASMKQGDPTAAIRYARRCMELEPFRESAYQREMFAQLALGNRADALLTYDRLRKLLAEELGADPSPALHTAYLEVLDA